MYRVELSPGEETAFRTIEELAVAIRRKVVTPRARIYHNATSKWLPIQFHPHYKLAASMPLTQADLVAGPPVAPLSALKLGESQAETPSTALPTPSAREAATEAALAAWPEPKPVSARAPQPLPHQHREAAPPVASRAGDRPAALPRQTVEPPRLAAPPLVQPQRMMQRQRRVLPPHSVQHATAVEPVRTTVSRPRRKPQRSLRVALAGTLLIACAHLVASSATAPPPEASARLRTPRQLINVPREAMTNVTPRTVAAIMPALQSIPVPGLSATSTQAAGLSPVAPVGSTTAQPKPAAAVSPAPLPAVVDSAPLIVSGPELEAPPDAGHITVDAPVRAESLVPQVVDSSGRKAMKGILRTIGGSPAPSPKSSK